MFRCISLMGTMIVVSLVMSEVRSARAQSPSPPEPFIAVRDGQDVETTEQSRRLQLIRKLPTTKSVHILRLNPSPPIGNEVKISIPHERSFVLSKTGGETVDAKDFTWFGVVKGEGSGSATLIARNGEISGSISTPDAVYRISPLGEGLYALAKMDTKKLPPEEPPKHDKNP